jgi:uncharacterized protein YabN with tetrapyrrole methylase and pyrophosphatase domain
MRTINKHIINKIINLLSGKDVIELENIVNNKDKEELYKFIKHEFLNIDDIKELIESINVDQSQFINIVSDIIELYLNNTNYDKALKRTSDLIERATSTGFDWSDNTSCFIKVEEEITELKEALNSKNKTHIKEELGDVIFTLFSFARLSKIDFIEAIEYANSKFNNRFKKLSEMLNEKNIDLKKLSDKEKEELWQKSKLNNENPT